MCMCNQGECSTSRFHMSVRDLVAQLLVIRLAPICLHKRESDNLDAIGEAWSPCACMRLQEGPGAALDDAAGAGLRPVQAPRARRARRPERSAARRRPARRPRRARSQKDPEDCSLAFTRGMLTRAPTHMPCRPKNTPESVTGSHKGSTDHTQCIHHLLSAAHLQTEPAHMLQKSQL